MRLDIFNSKNTRELTLEEDRIHQIVDLYQSVDENRLTLIVKDLEGSQEFKNKSFNTFAFFALFEYGNISMPLILSQAKNTYDGFIELSFRGIEYYFDNLVFFGKKHMSATFSTTVTGSTNEKVTLSIEPTMLHVFNKWISYTNTIMTHANGNTFINVDMSVNPLPINNNSSLIYSFNDNLTKISQAFDDLKQELKAFDYVPIFEYSGTATTFEVTMKVVKNQKNYATLSDSVYFIERSNSQEKTKGTVLLNRVPGNDSIKIKKSNIGIYSHGDNEKEDIVYEVKAMHDIFNVGDITQIDNVKLMCLAKEYDRQNTYAYTLATNDKAKASRVNEMKQLQKELKDGITSSYGEGIVSR